MIPDLWILSSSNIKEIVMGLVLNQIEKAYQQLEMLSVPRERAGSVSNG